MSIKLRQWQSEALLKSRQWFSKGQDSRFLLVTAPGSGKTLCACAIAESLIADNEIDRVVVIAPLRDVVTSWAEDFKQVTGRYMGKVTGCDTHLSEIQMDICATWSAVSGLQQELQAVCESSRVLVICDENHHAAIKAAWGSSAEGAFVRAKYSLILSGTPIRSDGEDAVWMGFDSIGRIDHPADGSYTLTYGEAVDLGYCRPATFHLHEGKFRIDLDGGASATVTGHEEGVLPHNLKTIPGLQSAIDFYRLAKTPQYEADGIRPLRQGYQGTMVDWGSEKLDQLRQRMPNAGGLVIAPTIEMAEYFCSLIELIEGERPTLVHSGLPNADSRIKAYRHGDMRWLVSVAMVSEGVDIPRLRVLVYLPSSLTEVSFRQAIGRVVRSAGPKDDTRAYVVMPSFNTFDRYARRVEREMSPAMRQPEDGPSFKRCPICESECGLGASSCSSCGHEFPERSPRLKSCRDCGALNALSANDCNVCGASFRADFVITLREALRSGAIVRGMELDEEEVVASENMADEFRNLVLRSGDENLVRVIQLLPEESYARLGSLFSDLR